MAVFYDTHAHLGYPDFSVDLPDVVRRAEAAGIGKMICIGTDLDSSREAIAIAERFPNVYAAIGWHPSHVLEAPSDLRADLRQLAAHPKVVALGETGLDFYRLPSKQEGKGPAADDYYKQRQKDLFAQHLEVAAETGLNVVVHQRDSLDAILEQFRPWSARVRAVFHCFANDAKTMEEIVGMGSLVSFTGILTFKNGQNIRDTLQATPPGRFMLETDCPFLAPVPHRGKRCEPAFVKEISEVAAGVRGCSLEELSRDTCAAAADFFRKISA